MLAKFIDEIKVIWKDRFAQVLMALFSTIFALVKSLSEFVYENDEVNIDIMQSGIYAVICYLLLNFAYYVITRSYHNSPLEIKSPKKLWWTFFVIFLSSYVICWMVYWPGTVHGDNWWIARSNINIAKQHPIIYCAFISLLVKIGTKLGSINYSIIIYTGLQMLAMSAFMSSLFVFIFQRKIPKILKIILILGCVLLPIYAIYTISNVKDVYWSLCLASFTISLYLIYTDSFSKQRKKFWILFNIYTLGIVLLRNNGIYIILPTLVCLLWIIPNQRKHLLLSIILVFLSFFLTHAWMNALNINPLFQEKIGVPIQQISAVVKKDGNITSAQREFISQIISVDTIKRRYNPFSTDAIKWGDSGFNSKFLNQNSSEFLKMWKNIISQNFKISVLAYLQAIYWYWAPNEQGRLNLILKTIPPEKHKLTPWILEHNYEEQKVLPDSMKKYLVKYYERACKFWHEGSLFWILTGCALIFYLKRRKLKDLIIYLPIFLLWGTLMIAAPIHDFRYVLSYIYVLPLYITLLFLDSEKVNMDANNYDIEKCYNKIKKNMKLLVKLCVIISVLWCGIWYFTIGRPITARIHLSVPYTKNQSFITLYNNESLSEAEWLQRYNQKGFVIQRRDNAYSCVLISFEDVDIDIVLKGVDEKDINGKRYEKWVKYTDFRIDGRQILSEPVDVWYEKPFKYVLKAEKNHAYRINLKWRKK